MGESPDRNLRASCIENRSKIYDTKEAPTTQLSNTTLDYFPRDRVAYLFGEYGENGFGWLQGLSLAVKITAMSHVLVNGHPLSQPHVSNNCLLIAQLTGSVVGRGNREIWISIRTSGAKHDFVGSRARDTATTNGLWRHVGISCMLQLYTSSGCGVGERFRAGFFRQVFRVALKCYTDCRTYIPHSDTRAV